MNKTIHFAYITFENQLDTLVNVFEESGQQFGTADRNTIKLFELNDQVVNVKSFKTPMFFNQIAYGFFRKSKAQRSFEYASRLNRLGIKTPEPIAFYEFPKYGLFKKSFYISKHLDYELTYRELTTDLDYKNHEIILRAFTRFTHDLHEKGVYFLDHSPGNTLITREKNSYEFYLVDLNRMQFRELDFEMRVRNFSKLTSNRSLIEIMSDEYAICSGKDKSLVLDLMWKYAQEFHYKHNRKKQLKKRFLFWKNL